MGNAQAPSQCKSADPATHVVIVGGSFAGLCVARHLERHHASLGLSLTLVEPREYFEYTPGILRAIADDSYDAKHLLVPLARTVRSPTKILHGWFVGVKGENKAVVRRVGGGEVELPCAYLIVCTGSSYAPPIKPLTHATDSTNDMPELGLSGRLASLRAEASRCAAATSVLLVGGGTVGVELAAEIAVRYVGKPVTLMTRSPVLLPTMPTAAQQAASGWLCGRKNVTVIYNDALNDLDPTLQQGEGGAEERIYRTKRGAVVKASLVLQCVGSKPCTAPFLPHCHGWSLGQGGGLRLQGSTLRVHRSSEGDEGNGNGNGEGVVVFAAGDVAAVPGEDKIASAAEAQAEAVARTVVQMQAARSGVKGRGAMDAYPQSIVGAETSPLVYGISLGPDEGILVFNDVVLGGNWLTRRVAALAKAFIEYTKILEVQQSWPALWLWEGIAHPIMFAVHRLQSRLFGRSASRATTA